MHLFESYSQGLKYHEFLQQHGTEIHRQRWAEVRSQVKLTQAQKQLLGEFRRTMPIICLAGAWCGDCATQCPAFDVFAELAPSIQVRFLDRDIHRPVQDALKINGGDRVPVLVFFSEDGQEVARYGERTLSKYRQMMRDQSGEGCATGIGSDPLLMQVVQDWLNEFERVQWILRLSPRLRRLHND